MDENLKIIVIIAAILLVLYTLGNKAGYEDITTPTTLEQTTTPTILMDSPLDTSTIPASSNVDMTIPPPTQVRDQVLTSSDLLPQLNNAANDFVKQNPVAKLLKDQNFLVSGYHIGINTVLTSSKIPYYDLRSAPVIPKQDLSPWNNSSIEDPPGAANRRTFEIGQ